MAAAIGSGTISTSNQLNVVLEVASAVRDALAAALVAAVFARPGRLLLRPLLLSLGRFRDDPDLGDDLNKVAHARKHKDGATYKRPASLKLKKIVFLSLLR